MSSPFSGHNSTTEDASPPPYSEGVDEKKVNEKQAEEVAPNTFVETLVEQILNDWVNDGPFVHRLKAYETPSGTIVIEEEKVKIEQGTKLEMAPFADCAFSRCYSDSFIIFSVSGDYIEIARNRASMKKGNCSFNNIGSGSGQKLDVANKAICTTINGDGASYVFGVKGKTIDYNCNRPNSGSAGCFVKGIQGTNVLGSSQVFNMCSSMDCDMDMSGLHQGMSDLHRGMTVMNHAFSSMAESTARARTAPTPNIMYRGNVQTNGNRGRNTFVNNWGGNIFSSN